MGRKDSKKRFPKGKAADGLPLKTPEVRSGTASPSGPSVPGQQAPDRWRPWLLAGAVALLVARPLYPSETPAETGDGLPVVMLWLALAVVWMLGLLGRRQWTFRFGLLDGVMVFLMVWTAGSAMMWARVSHARPAVNMLWEWVGLGLVFLLVRQWTAGQREIRAILAVMLALPAGQAAFAQSSGNLQAQMMSLMSVTKGVSVITEKIYPDRFMHVAELNRMGARIQREGPHAIVQGVERLSGAPVMASDLRASACLVLAGLVAEGRTDISRMYHLERGYENLEVKLQQLGAKIWREKG